MLGRLEPIVFFVLVFLEIEEVVVLGSLGRKARKLILTELYSTSLARIFVLLILALKGMGKFASTVTILLSACISNVSILRRQ